MRVQAATMTMMRGNVIVVSNIFVKIVGRILREIMILIIVMVQCLETPKDFAKSVLSEK